jgi:hypothetical protein
VIGVGAPVYITGDCVAVRRRNACKLLANPVSVIALVPEFPTKTEPPLLAVKIPVKLGTLRVSVWFASVFGSPSSRVAPVNSNAELASAVIFRVLGKLLMLGPRTAALIPTITALEATEEVTSAPDSVLTMTDIVRAEPACAPLKISRPEDRY